MSDYIACKVYASDKRSMAQVDALLVKEGIKRDGNLDYTCAVYDDDANVIATGSAFGNTLRCMAVSSDHQGEGLMNIIVSHLVDMQFERGNTHIFLYTKVNTAKFFSDLGFHEIYRVDGTLVFMENKADGFASYLRNLSKSVCIDGVSAAIVMNANPFTKGHRYLIDRACEGCDHLHLFVVSEEKSLVPFNVRKQLISAGTADLKDKVIMHDSGPYMISNATFPSYFLKDSTAVMEGHARLDAGIFTKIASVLNITKRFVGDEPTSQVTAVYNQVLSTVLPMNGIDVSIIPRVESEGRAISASDVRVAIKNGDIEMMKRLLPQSSYDFFVSESARLVIDRIKAADQVVHH